MLKKLIAIFAILFGTFSVSGCAPEVTNELPQVGIIIENASISVGETKATVSAKITNRANGTVTLTGAQTEAAEEVKLVKGTEPLNESVDIHVGQTLELSETGKHLVLMKLTKPITFGDKVTFTFEFEGAESQTVVLVAK